MANQDIKRDRNNTPVMGGVTSTGEIRNLAVDEEGAIITGGVESNVHTDIKSTAWGIGKTSEDLSLFHGIWTYNIPQSIWNIEENGTRLSDNDSSTLCISNNGELNISSGTNLGDLTTLRSRRHPRYQPNRGHYFATAGFLDNPTAIGSRQFGLKSNGNGVYFELEDGIMYAVVENSDGPNIKEEITIPDGIDLSKGNLYDIQFQWRGVGNYYFYINLDLVKVVNVLGTANQVTLSNPAMSVHYCSENTDGTQVGMRFGCCDITSEGGQREGKTYRSATNDIGASQGRNISGQNQPLIILRAKETHYGKLNTIDVILNRISISSDQKSIGKLWFTRDGTAIGGTAYPGALYKDIGLGSSIEMVDCVGLSSTEITFDITKATQVYSGRVPQDDSLQVGNPSEDIEFFIEAGDYLILTGEREGGLSANMFGTIEMGEEI